MLQHRHLIGLFLAVFTTGCSQCGGVFLPSNEDAGSAASSSGSSGSVSSGSQAGSSGGTSSGGTSDAGVRDAGPQPVSLEVLPTPAELDAQPGTGGDLPLTVNVRLTDNTTRAARSPFFRSASPELGTMSANVFHALGTRSGTASVQVRAEGLETMKSVVVRVRQVIVGTGGPSNPTTAFGGMEDTANPAKKPSVLYPLNGVVIPLNLAPMVIQWRSTLSNAYFHIRFEGSAGSLDAYTAAGATQYQPSDGVWRTLLQGHVGGQITLRVEGVESAGGPRFVATPVTINLANADLTSVVYYWTLSSPSSAQGKIVRIGADGTHTSLALGSGFDCHGCHTLSSDGQRMAVSFGGGDTPGGVVDPATPQTPVVGPPATSNANIRWHFAAYNPDRTRLLTVRGARMTLRDANTLAELTDGGVAYPVSHPAWAPTGGKVAYASIVGADDIGFSQSNLVVANESTSGLGSTFFTVPGTGKALFYPGFTPRGDYVAFNRGNISRSSTQNYSAYNLATMEWVSTQSADAGVPLVLAAANPDTNSYGPSFNPKIEGGKMWMAFWSYRPYGHVVANTNTPNGYRGQIWVAAVDENPVAGTDPSHPPFWLPGQDTLTQNLSSYFAPLPCKAAGQECTSDLNCCNGNLCRPNAGGTLVCTPPEEACLLPGDACTADTDCCEGAGPCFDTGEGIRECTPPALQCKRVGDACEFNSDCCANAGTCFTRNGMRTCTLPADQCRGELDACTSSTDCCEPLGCSGGLCQFPG